MILSFLKIFIIITFVLFLFNEVLIKITKYLYTFFNILYFIEGYYLLVNYRNLKSM